MHVDVLENCRGMELGGRICGEAGHQQALMCVELC